MSGTDLAPKEINPFPGAAMTISYIANSIDRLGFHYFPDSLHYREQDFQTWLPEMQNLGASWVTLIAPIERAIPEFFIEGLIASKIKPILHFPLFNNQDKETFQSLIRTYARWGVKYVTLFDQPNYRKNWTPSAWVQADLVERFLDDFLPLAEIVYQEEIHPIFPPLVPGGDYWDIAFLRTALRNIKRRSEKSLIDSMIIGTYAYTGNRPLDWGFGGPERWPGARPYFTPSGLQDQLGFRVFDWYFAIAQEELGKALPIILLRAGPRIGDHNDETFPPIDDLTHSKIILEIVKQLACNLRNGESPRSIPEEVLACNFWLLSTDVDDIYSKDAWYQPDGQTLDCVNIVKEWLEQRETFSKSTINEKEDGGNGYSLESQEAILDADLLTHPISHYLLLPHYAWGVADWDMELIREFVQKKHATIGFSLLEALHAARVTVVGGEGAFSEEALNVLRNSGCVVERIDDRGMEFASNL